MIFKVLIVSETGRTFYIDTVGSISGLFAKVFENFTEAESYAKSYVQKTFPSYKIYVEEYTSPYARRTYQVNV